MQKYRVLIPLAIVVLLSAWLAYTLRPSDEKRIAKNLNQVCLILSKGESENPALLAFKMFDFARFCAEQVSFDIEEAPIKGSYSNEQLISEASRYRAMCESLQLSIMDLETEVNDENQALVRGTLKVKLTAQGYSFDEMLPLQIQMRKIERAWKITRVAKVKIFSK
ncbi:MAG: hypothetical protein PHG44_02255 [Lentisphaeria bacterium]|jgi:hypothetical protein|nr:hypothetical protein [Lentisphaeria bacterium]MDY0177431.1 hypothetical protein [Lentisphaeria bacterium]